MDLRKVFIIFSKEMLDIFRDKRTVFTSIILPILLYPILIIGINSIMSRQIGDLRDKVNDIIIIDNIRNETTKMIVQKLDEHKNLSIHSSSDDFLMLLEERIIEAAVLINQPIGDDIHRAYNIEIIYNEIEERSLFAFSDISETLLNLRDEILKERLLSINISETILQVFDVNETNIATPRQTTGSVIARILPYLLILLCISSAAIAAVDIVAGEKERGTLETILVSAATRSELVLGKYFTIIAISLITILMNLFSIFLSVHHILSQSITHGGISSLPFTDLILIFLTMLPTIAFYSGLLLSLSTYSRNIKEATSYIQPVLIVSIFLSLVSMFPAFRISTGVSFLPIINVSLLIKEILIDGLNLNHFFITLVSMSFFASISIFISIKLFHNESILFRIGDETSFKSWKKDKSNVLKPTFALFFFFAVLLSMYYIGSTWQSRDISTGLIKTLVFIVFIPPVFIVLYAKKNILREYRINSSSFKNYLLVFLISIPLFIIVNSITTIINYLYPIPDIYIDFFSRLFLERSFFFNLLLIAVLPGITEEIMFRGYFLRAFESKGYWNAILVSSIMFAVMHLDFFRLIQITLIGIWLGYATLKTNSICIPIFAHILNNAYAVILTHFGSIIPGLEALTSEGFLNWWLIAPALVLFLFLVKSFDSLNSSNIKKLKILEES